MPAPSNRLIVHIGSNVAPLSAGLKAASAQVSGFGAAARRAGKAAALGVAALGAVAVKVGAEIAGVSDQMDKALVAGTGATGKALDDLRQNVLAVGRDVPQALGDVAGIVADVNTRFAFTGQALTDTSRLFADFARVTGHDTTQAVTDLSSAMTIFGEQGAAAVEEGLGDLLRVQQATGIDMGKLFKVVGKYGSAFETLGFTLEETTALIGELSTAGVDMRKMEPSMKLFARAAIDQGRDPRQALEAVGKAIREATTDADAMAVAAEHFPQEFQLMTKAFRTGAFDIQNFGGLLGKGTGIIDDQADAAETLGDKFGMIRNRIIEALLPAVKDTVEYMEDLVGVFVNEGWDAGLSKLIDDAGKLPGPFGDLSVAVLAAVDHIDELLAKLAEFAREVTGIRSGEDVFDVAGSAVEDVAAGYTSVTEQAEQSPEGRLALAGGAVATGGATLKLAGRYRQRTAQAAKDAERARRAFAAADEKLQKAVGAQVGAVNEALDLDKLTEARDDASRTAAAKTARAKDSKFAARLAADELKTEKDLLAVRQESPLSRRRMTPERIAADEKRIARLERDAENAARRHHSAEAERKAAQATLAERDAQLKEARSQRRQIMADPSRAAGAVHDIEAAAATRQARAELAGINTRLQQRQAAVDAQRRRRPSSPKIASLGERRAVNILEQETAALAPRRQALEAQIQQAQADAAEKKAAEQAKIDRRTRQARLAQDAAADAGVQSRFATFAKWRRGLAGTGVVEGGTRLAADLYRKSGWEQWSAEQRAARDLPLGALEGASRYGPLGYVKAGLRGAAKGTGVGAVVGAADVAAGRTGTYDRLMDLAERLPFGMGEAIESRHHDPLYDIARAVVGFVLPASVSDRRWDAKAQWKAREEAMEAAVASGDTVAQSRILHHQVSDATGVPMLYDPDDAPWADGQMPLAPTSEAERRRMAGDYWRKRAARARIAERAAAGPTGMTGLHIGGYAGSAPLDAAAAAAVRAATIQTRKDDDERARRAAAGPTGMTGLHIGGYAGSAPLDAAAAAAVRAATIQTRKDDDERARRSGPTPMGDPQRFTRQARAADRKSVEQAIEAAYGRGNAEASADRRSAGQALSDRVRFVMASSGRDASADRRAAGAAMAGRVRDVMASANADADRSRRAGNSALATTITRVAERPVKVDLSDTQTGDRYLTLNVEGMMSDDVLDLVRRWEAGDIGDTTPTGSAPQQGTHYGSPLNYPGGF